MQTPATMLFTVLKITFLKYRSLVNRSTKFLIPMNLAVVIPSHFKREKYSDPSIGKIKKTVYKTNAGK